MIGKEPIINIEQHLQHLDRSPKSFLLRLLPCHHCHPVPDHCIHHYIENCGGEWVLLSDSVVTFEQGSILLSCMGNHGEVLPVVVEEAFHP